ncbi:hypothetical protein [Moorena producens]|uniref:hypothetical protein n=1 Tax=Moorena producens TaxID=1155739 RepID=UPI003C71FC0D
MIAHSFLNSVTPIIQLRSDRIYLAPVPYSLLPTPYSLLPTPYLWIQTPLNYRKKFVNNLILGPIPEFPSTAPQKSS